MAKNTYIRAAMKAAGIRRTSYNGYWPRTAEGDAKISVFLETLKSLGFERTKSPQADEYEFIFSKEDEKVTVNYRFGALGYSAFWLEV